LRGAAEFDNYRSAPIASATCRMPVVDLMRDLLRSWTTSSGHSRQRGVGAAAGALCGGVELIHRQLLDVMRRRGVRPWTSVSQIRSELARRIASEPAAGRRDAGVVIELRRATPRPPAARPHR
jgi:hypothetical protein